MLGYFDKERFAELLKLAIGDKRSMNEYGRETNVSGSYISRLSRGIVSVAPSADIIAKLAKLADNKITYKELMVAAGHLPETETDSYDITQLIEGDLKNTDFIHTIDDLSEPRARSILSKAELEVISMVEKEQITTDEIKQILSVIRMLNKKK